MPQSGATAVQHPAMDGNAVDMLEQQPLIPGDAPVIRRCDEHAIDVHRDRPVAAWPAEPSIAEPKNPERHVDEGRLWRPASRGPCAKEGLGGVGLAVGFGSEGNHIVEVRCSAG